MRRWPIPVRSGGCWSRPGPTTICVRPARRPTRSAAAARSAEDEAARHARLHQSRALRIGEGRDGHVEIHGQFTPAAFAGGEADPRRPPEGAGRAGPHAKAPARAGTPTGPTAFLAAIAAGSTTPTATTPGLPGRDRAGLAAAHRTGCDAPAARRTGRRPPLRRPGDASEGRLFAPGDDLGAAEGLDPKVNWNLVVLVDGIALKRGYAAPGETCEIPGIGPIPVTWIHRLLPERPRRDC